MMHKIRRTMVQGALQKMERLPGMMFQGERNAHCFVIAPMEGVSFAGYGVAGRCVREDRADVNISGYLDAGGNAVVPVTPACCDVPGLAKFFVYVVKDEETVCVYACWADIQHTQGGGTAEDGEPIIEYYPDERMDAIEEAVDGLAPAIIETAGPAAVAQFPDGAEGMPMQLSVQIQPTQDLHGYDAPWPAGGSINLWPHGERLEAAAAYELPAHSGQLILSFCKNPDTSMSINYLLDGETKWRVMMEDASPARLERWSFMLPEETAQVLIPASGSDPAYNIMLESRGSSANPSDFVPYANVCPIQGYDEATVTVSPTEKAADGAATAFSFPAPVYAGTLTIFRNGSGRLAARPCYASYNGEALVGPWLSSLDAYEPGKTPTIGAQVVDLGGEETISLFAPGRIKSLAGQNFVWCDVGAVTAHYTADTKTYVDAGNASGAALARVTSLDETELAPGTAIEAVGIPVYVADVSQYAAYGIAEKGWHVFARIKAPDGESVTAETAITGAAGDIAELGADHVDLAVRFDTTAQSVPVTIRWGGAEDRYIFKASDLAARNLDYRVTFYIYDLDPYCTWTYALTTDTAFVANKQYYTKDGDVYTPAAVTAGDAVPADAYYNHSKVTFAGMTANVTYKLDTIIDCPVEIVLPEVADDGHGAWFEVQLRYDTTRSCTLLPPAGVKVGTAQTQAQSAGINTIDLQYTIAGDVKMWTLLNTHSNIPA